MISRARLNGGVELCIAIDAQVQVPKNLVPITGPATSTAHETADDRERSLLCLDFVQKENLTLSNTFV